MRCAQCKREINAIDARKAVVEKDENGRLKAAFHYKCKHIRTRQAQLALHERGGGPTVYEQSASKMNADDLTDQAYDRRVRAEAELTRLKELHAAGVAPSAVVQGTLQDLIADQEQVVVLARRQEEIAAEKLKEARPEGWSDYRDPAEVDI